MRNFAYAGIFLHREFISCMTSSFLFFSFAAFMSLELRAHCNADCIYFFKFILAPDTEYGYLITITVMCCCCCCCYTAGRRLCTVRAHSTALFALLLRQFVGRIFCHVAPTQRCIAPRGIVPHITVLRTRPANHQATSAICQDTGRVLLPI